MFGKYISAAGIPGDVQITGAPSVTGAGMSGNANQTGTQLATLSVNPPSWVGTVANSQFPFLADGQGRPDLLIIALGVNDPASTTRRLTDVNDGLSAIMSPNVNGTTLDYSPDVVIILEHQGNWFDADREWPEIATQTRALAHGFGAAFIDMWGLGNRSHQYWEDLGLFADNIHPNRAGHTVYARALLDVVMAP
jgi:lysophospholipase L1-like esterase